MIEANQDINGRTVFATAGLPFKLQFHSKASAGYLWKIETQSGLKISDSVHVIPDGFEEQIGSGNEVFECVGDLGVFHVKAELKRPFEPATVEPIEVLEFDVDCKG